MHRARIVTSFIETSHFTYAYIPMYKFKISSVNQFLEFSNWSERGIDHKNQSIGEGRGIKFN